MVSSIDRFGVLHGLRAGQVHDGLLLLVLLLLFVFFLVGGVILDAHGLSCVDVTSRICPVNRG